MTETTQPSVILTCDICSKQVKEFEAKLDWSRNVRAMDGCVYSQQVIRIDICSDCCSKVSEKINSLKE